MNECKYAYRIKERQMSLACRYLQHWYLADVALDLHMLKPTCDEYLLLQHSPLLNTCGVLT